MHENNAGSQWLRWEPHIHIPGTIFNDQYGENGELEAYLTKIEDLTPVVRAIGITDYYVTESYERIRAEKANGRLTNCNLVFANIELRLSIGTVKGNWVNMHLLVSPEDPKHLDHLNRFLGQLHFKMPGDTFACTPGDLRRLGQRHKAELTTERAQLAEGAKQFKVDIDELKSAYEESTWAKENILIAVAGGDDGVGGVRDAADEALRQKIASFAHIVFASSDAQREFWLGQKAASVQELEAGYNGLKPCLHGSDAHDLASVGAPAGDRFTWLKGAPTFDALRQAAIAPRTRAFVGPTPPRAAMSSWIMSSIEIADAEWMLTPKVEFNPGLVAIIGARGSGKTALADILARGCGAKLGDEDMSSFLARAKPLLEDAAGTLTWKNGKSDTFRLNDDLDDPWALETSRACYLSQKFVEKLCSSEGMTDALLEEIERVIFSAHDSSTTADAWSFRELLDNRAGLIRQQRDSDADLIRSLSSQISVEQEKKAGVASLNVQIKEKQDLIARYEKERATFVVKGTEPLTARIIELSQFLDKVKTQIRLWGIRKQTLEGLKIEVQNTRTNQAPENLRALRDKFRQAGFSEDHWKWFQLDYSGDVDAVLTTELKKCETEIEAWYGPEATTPSGDASLISPTAELERLRYHLLDAEIQRLQAKVKLDSDTAEKFRLANNRVSNETVALGVLTDRLSDAQGATQRITELQDQREAAYKDVFESIIDEEGVLRELYSPLVTKLVGAKGTLGRLRFSVTRKADVAKWAGDGERLYDLRLKGDFKGEGKLLEHANAKLWQPWETGTADEVAAAMSSFRRDHLQELLKHAPRLEGDGSAYRNWMKRLANWLFGTDHISLKYSIDYDGVDIRNLSPGTRGIVLLMLYLALDEKDDRPLIIDQPEENLDPKSIYDELVDLFVDARRRRQVIMVTHNANLVVNTDADQVIVASCQPRSGASLPPITYVSGGLEEAHIRKLVCDILEGGERAFTDRARRLRINLHRI